MGDFDIRCSSASTLLSVDRGKCPMVEVSTETASRAVSIVGATLAGTGEAKVELSQLSYANPVVSRGNARPSQRAQGNGSRTALKVRAIPHESVILYGRT